MLYDSQLTNDYLIIFNNTQNIMRSYSKDIPYHIRMVLNEDNLSKTEHLNMMSDACKDENIILMKNDDIITKKAMCKSHMKNYNGYDIFWNETKSGIDISEYDNIGIWSPGNSSLKVYYIDRKPDNRDKIIKARKRAKNLHSLLRD